MKKRYLLAPGPTPVPEKVLLTMAQPMFHHRTPQYSKLLSEVEEKLKHVFQTRNNIFILVSSGTGAMESAITNFFSPGDKVICVRGGKFGERWGELCKVYNLNTVFIDIEWGTAVKPEAIEEALKEHPDAKAVLTTHSETSTGVVTDLESIGKIVARTPAILITDAVSSLGALNLETDNWNVDIVVAGSQKGLMIPSGLAFISVSEKAWKMVETAKLPKYYFDLRKYYKSLQKWQDPFTGGVNLLVGLKETLQMIEEEGLQNVFERHRKLAEACRSGVQAIGLELFAKQPSNVVTAVKVPEGIDGTAITKKVRDEYGITIAGGQAQLKGKIFRIAHMGYSDRFDMILAISAIEMVLTELGYNVPLGKGVAACEEYFLKNW